jgi:hypothetical protein
MYDFLLDQGVAPGHVNEMWWDFLRGLSYEGTLTEMIRAWEDGGFVVGSIAAVVSPATSVLVVGDALEDTTNWSTFLNTSNYTTDAGGETIDTVVVNFVGDTANATEAFEIGETNQFSITVTDTGGNSRTFTTSPLTVEYSATSFVGTVVTTGADESVTFPMRDTGTYNATLNPGDGSAVVTGLTAFDSAGWTHTYATPGTHTFIIDGTKGAPHWYSSATDRPKLRSVINLGSWNGADHRNAFRDSGLTSFVAGNSDVSSTTLMTGYIQDCSDLVQPDLSDMDISNVTNFRTFADSCASLTGIDGLETWVPTAGEQFDEFAWDCPSLDATTLRIGTWSTPNLLPESGSFLGFFNFIPNDKALDVDEYAAFLQVQNGLSLTGGDYWYGFGTSPVAAGAATTARTDMIANKTRFFTDGETDVPDQMSAPSLSVSGTVITVNLAEGTFNNGLPVLSEDIRYSEDESTWTVVDDATDPDDIETSTSETEFFVQTRAVNFLGEGSWSASASITTEAVAAISVENDGDEPVVTAPYNDSAFVYTVGSGDQAGTYTQRVTDSATLTTNMIQAAATPITNPSPTGSTGLGDTVTALVPLFLYDGADPGETTFQWQSDGVDISGATAEDFTITASEQDTDLRRISTFDGVSVTSATITIPAAATAPSAFVDANWSVATGSGANELDITIASLPSDGGSTITDVEYDIDASGTWISLSTATTGTETVTMAAPATSYAIRLRAVNGAGNGAAGNSESATSGAAAGFAGRGDDAGTLHYWDADESTLTLSGSEVTLVEDLVGSQDLPALGAPTTGRLQNSLNSIDMPNDSGNAYLRFNNTFDLSEDTFAIHVAMSIDSIGGTSEALFGMNLGSSTFNIRANNATQFDGRIELQNLGSTTAVNFTGGPYSGLVIVSVVFDDTGSTFTVYVNGSSVATGNYTGFLGTTGGRLRFGAQNSGGNTMDSAFHTALITTSIDNVSDWTTWLDDRWRP